VAPIPAGRTPAIFGKYLMNGPRHFFINSSSGKQFSTGGWLSYLIMLPFIAGAVVVGFFFFTALLALFSVIVLLVAARFWWLRRKLRRQAASRGGQAPSEGAGGVLEGEYVVITKQTGKNKP
jgi:membrane protein implicated in regulation of membrane protease activity